MPDNPFPAAKYPLHNSFNVSILDSGIMRHVSFCSSDEKKFTHVVLLHCT